MQHLIYAIIVSFIICLVLGPVVIRALRVLKFVQTVRADGPATHLKKTGTPTMGGVLIIVAIIISTFLFSSRNYNYVIIALFVTIGFGFIGFLDDFIKIIKKRSLGLRAYQKLLMQIAVAFVFAIYAYKDTYIGSKIIIPFVNKDFDLGIWYIPVIIFIMVGVTNSVNLTDGIDGLASGSTLIFSASFSIIYFYAMDLALKSGFTYQGVNLQNMMLFSGAVTGACLGFLRFNTFPAKVIMGDTGSLALGGAVSAMAIMYRLPLLLPIMGGVFMAETISVIMQVTSFKLTGKRIFKMAPLHHHFELTGMPETKIVSFFMIATTILCLIGLLTLH